jgi:hypothetical protein
MCCLPRLAVLCTPSCTHDCSPDLAFPASRTTSNPLKLKLKPRLSRSLSSSASGLCLSWRGLTLRVLFLGGAQFFVLAGSSVFLDTVWWPLSVLWTVGCQRLRVGPGERYQTPQPSHLLLGSSARSVFVGGAGWADRGFLAGVSFLDLVGSTVLLLAGVVSM